ncbi:YkgJ family cysteine cluster protein [Chloroflexota bacterium]
MPEKQIECFRCGVCCTRFQPQLNEEEWQRLAAGLEMPPESFLAEYAVFTNIGYLLRHGERGCVFMQWDENGLTGGCKVYEHRPDACRHWQAGLGKKECTEGLEILRAVGIDVG